MLSRPEGLHASCAQIQAPKTSMLGRTHRADTTGQTALHWSAVRGSLLAAEALLGSGADHRLRDGRGYTACHVAAQYGQTAFLYMAALRWRADIDRCPALSPAAASHALPRLVAHPQTPSVNCHCRHQARAQRPQHRPSCEPLKGVKTVAESKQTRAKLTAERQGHQ